MQNYFIITILRLYVLIQNLVECKCLSTGGPRLVRIFGPGKNCTSEIRTSGYYIANSTSTNFIPIALKIIQVEFLLMKTLLFSMKMCN